MSLRRTAKRTEVVMVPREMVPGLRAMLALPTPVTAFLFDTLLPLWEKEEAHITASPEAWTAQLAVEHPEVHARIRALKAKYPAVLARYRRRLEKLGRWPVASPPEEDRS